ncbi:MAG: hypothetical protein JWN95_2041 [Frankiales bacterium]|nr:hypothetical protein [Frankiales bacterium]
MTYQYSDDGRDSRRDDVILDPPPYVLTRHGAAVLDPAVALRLPGQDNVRATVYARSRLLIRAELCTEETLAAVSEAAERIGTTARVDLDHRAEMHDAAGRAGVDDVAERVLALRILLEPPADRSYVPADAWSVLQTFRELLGPGHPAATALTLDHLLTASALSSRPPWGDPSLTTGYPPPPGPSYPTSAGSGFAGSGFAGSGFAGAGFAGAGFAGASEYGSPGVGPRMPVNWFGRPPVRALDYELSSRRPVVVLLDSGVGVHPWLPADVVQRYSALGQLSASMDEDDRNAAELIDPLEGSGSSDAGHGTFIAGLIRQTCPDANLLSVRVMHGDGAVSESDLTDALTLLLFRQHEAIRQGRPDRLVDVITLACGYYPELPDDPQWDSALTTTLRELGSLGVTVVTSAGNDASNRPLYPAMLAPGGASRTEPDAVPLVCVGALNPDGNTVALFSNTGSWVSAHRPGAACVSTMPVTFDASLLPMATVLESSEAIRATIDPDNFAGGFATWSGTSFAAAVLAGEVAQSLLETGGLDATVDPAAAVAIAWRAVEDQTGLARPY